MTNIERAEKILSLCHLPYSDAAYSKARHGIPVFLKKDVIAHLDQAQAEAFEKAATEADEHNGCIDKECFDRNCAVVIAERIRALKADK